MNYEQLLDEIMVNTLAAQELLPATDCSVTYALCPATMQFHTMLFLTASLLTMDQDQPLLVMVQVDDLPEAIMRYSGEIGPHFGRVWQRNEEILSEIPATNECYYSDLERLFCYLAVLNPHSQHQVLFVKKGVLKSDFLRQVQELLQGQWSLLVLVDGVTGNSAMESKLSSQALLSHCLEQQMSEEEQLQFPVLSYLSSLMQGIEKPVLMQEIISPNDVGLEMPNAGAWRCLLR